MASLTFAEAKERMNKMTEGNCRIGYTKSQAWILKVLLVYYQVGQGFRY